AGSFERTLHSQKKFPYLCAVIAKTKLTDIRSLSLEQLKEQLVQMGELGFRAKQIYEWLWKKSVVDFDAMSNLSISLREKLKAHYVNNSVRVKQYLVRADKTITSSFLIFNKNINEGKLIPTHERITECVRLRAISILTCKFCATDYIY